jgi:ATP-dependent Clp protease ATP-binding subunit ClpA
MFERFTMRSKDTIAQAQEEARSLGHNYIGTEHLLLGLLHDADSMAGKYLTDCGVTLDRARTRVTELVGPVALSDQDAEALSTIGIDLDAVREAVESTFGPGALDPEPPKGCARIPFTARAKKTLGLALREAIHLQHNYIGTEHILLGLIREGDGIGARILIESGVHADGMLRRLRPGA